MLPELVLGTLPEEQRTQVEQHLAGCGRCTAELQALGEALLVLPLALDAVPPSAEVRARMFGQLTLPMTPELLTRVARFFDLAIERAREVLLAIDEPSAWVPLLPGISLLHFAPGLALAGADTGLVRVAAEARFPPHRHLGDERVLILMGALREDDGRVLRPGDESAMPQGSSHEFAALPGSDCIFAASVFGGFELLPSE